MHHRASIARRSSSFDAPFCTHCVESPQGFSPFAARVVAPRRPVPPRLFRVVALSFTTVRAFALIAALILRSNPVVVVVVVSPRSARSRRTSRASAGPRASSRRRVVSRARDASASSRARPASRPASRVASLDGRTARVVPDSTSMCGRDATRRAAEDRGSRIKKNPRATRIKRERFAMKAETRDARSISNDRSIDRSIDRTNERSNDRSTDERFEGAAKPNARR